MINKNLVNVKLECWLCSMEKYCVMMLDEECCVLVMNEVVVEGSECVGVIDNKIEYWVLEVCFNSLNLNFIKLIVSNLGIFFCLC